MTSAGRRTTPSPAADRYAVSAAVFIAVLHLLLLPCSAKQVPVPPMIVSEAQDEIAYRVRELVEIPCVASGDPPPSYEWRKDDEPLAITGIDIRQVPGVGTIYIEDPTVEQHEGVYQCFARNSFGTAISIRTMLKKAVQEPFPSVREPKVHRPVVGNSLTLQCKPPYGYPEGIVYWGEFKSGEKLKPIENTERVSLDYEGDLHFSNIELSDDRAGLHYVCIVQNTELRSLMQGDDQKIEPIPLSGTAALHDPMSPTYSHGDHQ